MGTRHVVIIKKKVKLMNEEINQEQIIKEICVGFYGQYDGYPSGCGTIIQQFLRDIAVENNESKFFTALMAAEECFDWEDETLADALKMEYDEMQWFYPEICNKGAHVLMMLLHGKHAYLNQQKEHELKMKTPTKDEESKENQAYSLEGVDNEVKFFVNENSYWKSWDCEWIYYLDMDDRNITIIYPMDKINRNDALKKIFTFDDFIGIDMPTLDESFGVAAQCIRSLIIPDQLIRHKMKNPISKPKRKFSISDDEAMRKYQNVISYLKNKI